MEMNATLLIPIIYGWIAGIFVNYVSDVLPQTRRFSQPVCRHCQHPIGWVDYLTLRTCKNCRKGRNLRAWLVQVLALSSFIYFWLFPSERLGFWLGALLLVYFGILTVIDLEHRLILHVTTLTGAVLGLFVGVFIYMKKYSLLISLGYSLLGGVIGFGIMFVLYQIGAIVARRRARKMQAAGQAADDEDEGLGGGDVYLLGVLGLMLGPSVVAVLFYGALFGGLASLLLIIAYLIQRRSSRDALMTFIPYGPYFIIVAFFTLFF